MHNAAAVLPTWVMCGVDIAPGRVVLLASKDLTQAELEAHAAEVTMRSSPMVPVRREYTLSTTMRSFVRIEADDWPSAFRGLFARWTPENEQPSLT